MNADQEDPILLLTFGLERNNDAARNTHVLEPYCQFRSTTLRGSPANQIRFGKVVNADPF
jgi:hypothetical protein